MNKLEIALKEYQKYNGIRNDLDAYLWELGRWAIDGFADRPDPEDYGLTSPNKAIEPTDEAGGS